MADKIVRDILAADAGVIALVADRIEYEIKQQGETFPAITVARTNVQPTMHLTGDASLDQCTVRVDSWATTLTQARQVSDACRTALISTNIQLQSEHDNYESGIDPGLYLITQEFLVWK